MQMNNGFVLYSKQKIWTELTAHNWLKWKSIFLSWYRHEIYREEAVGLKNSNYTWKITIFVNMWNLGQFP